MRNFWILAIGFLVACGEEEEVGPTCGNGLLDMGEACDNGDFNSDEIADECRTNCQFAFCGDGVTDFGETCDDGNNVDFDGCSADCVFEGVGTEEEPNNTPDEAEILDGAERGNLQGDDVDCFRLTAQTCGTIALGFDGDCGDGLRIALYDGEENLLAVADTQPGLCPDEVDLSEVPGPLLAGDFDVCLSTLGEDVQYELTGTVEGGIADTSELEDDDEDGWPDECDSCPGTTNRIAHRQPVGNGSIRPWLLRAAQNEGDGCEPQGELFAGEASAAPAAGDRDWAVLLSGNNTINLGNRFSGELTAPRESFAVVYVNGDQLPDSVLVSYGADDGSRVYWNGVQVNSESSCQGVQANQFSAEVEVAPGWNRLALRVRDQGGGWGYTLRLRDLDDADLSDYDLSLDPFGAWRPDQRDSDGDGTADVCD